MKFEVLGSGLKVWGHLEEVGREVAWEHLAELAEECAPVVAAFEFGG